MNQLSFTGRSESLESESEGIGALDWLHFMGTLYQGAVHIRPMPILLITN